MLGRIQYTVVNISNAVIDRNTIKRTTIRSRYLMLTTEVRRHLDDNKRTMISKTRQPIDHFTDKIKSFRCTKSIHVSWNIDIANRYDRLDSIYRILDKKKTLFFGKLWFFFNGSTVSIIIYVSKLNCEFTKVHVTFGVTITMNGWDFRIQCYHVWIIETGGQACTRTHMYHSVKISLHKWEPSK